MFEGICKTSVGTTFVLFLQTYDFVDFSTRQIENYLYGLMNGTGVNANFSYKNSTQKFTSRPCCHAGANQRLRVGAG